MEIKASETMKHSYRSRLALKPAFSAVLLGCAFVALMLAGRGSAAVLAVFLVLWLYFVYSYTIYCRGVRAMSAMRVFLTDGGVLIYTRTIIKRGSGYLIRHIFYEPEAIRFSFTDKCRLILFGIIKRRECDVRCHDLLAPDDDVLALAERAEKGRARLCLTLTVARVFDSDEEKALRDALACLYLG